MTRHLKKELLVGLGVTAGLVFLGAAALVAGTFALTDYALKEAFPGPQRDEKKEK